MNIDNLKRLRDHIQGVSNERFTRRVAGDLECGCALTHGFLGIDFGLLYRRDDDGNYIYWNREATWPLFTKLSEEVFGISGFSNEWNKLFGVSEGDKDSFLADLDELINTKLQSESV